MRESEDERERDIACRREGESVRVQSQEMYACAQMKEEHMGRDDAPAQGELCTSISLGGQAACLFRRSPHSHLTSSCFHDLTLP